MKYRTFYHPYGEPDVEKFYDNEAPEMKQAIAEFDSRFLGISTECLNVTAIITSVSRASVDETLLALKSLQRYSSRRYQAVIDTYQASQIQYLAQIIEKMKGSTPE